MTNGLQGQKVAVIGWDPSGFAACALLTRLGARVFAVPAEGAGPSQHATPGALSPGAVLARENELPDLDLAVLSGAVSRHSPTARKFLERNIPVISDLELATQNFCCLSIGISGTNGKTTTAELVAAMLEHSGRKTLRAGASGAPVCSVTDQTRELDLAVLDLNTFQLESIEHFRPAVAVLLNVKPDHIDKYDRVSRYVETFGALFKNQQVFDWAIIQSEALAYLRELKVKIPSKIVTFSATSRRADIYLDRTLLISSIQNWSGPLFDLEQSALRGPHNAENVMAALAIGRVLRLPLEEMTAAIRAYRPGPHRMELVTEHQGVRFINNSKAVNVAAVQQSLEALPRAAGGGPNVWLIAGGKDKELDYHDLGPLLAQRVKGAFLLGETAEKLRAAWSLFTPCMVVPSLLEAVSKAAESAEAGDVVLLSPACSSFDMFQSYQHRGDVFRHAVERLVQGGRSAAGAPFPPVRAGGPAPSDSPAENGPKNFEETNDSKTQNQLTR